MNTRVIQIAAIGAMACVASSAGAQVVTYSWGGTVRVLTPTPPYGTSPFVGQACSGTFSYDSTTPDQSPSTNFGRYPQAPPQSFTFTLASGDVVIESFFDVFVTLNPVVPTFQEMEVFGSTGIVVNGVPQPSAELYIQFRDMSSTVFSSDTLPDASLTINDFTFGVGYFRDVSTGDRIDFTIESLNGIPSSGPAALIVAGALVALGRRRR